ncbi:PspC domain-containing protein [Paenibacillus donghaensis]|uniref:Phage shock protein PspC N-terminal domain-containing protein n=1 Tax=Paenibacillus donghaensis TaxID=414771 RepID=A0A2Z2K5C9_9BACL|nr:PspC domain-containing protein [Paenibacillus donghaensis]ASA19714.1 hypothetical protein B9T62_02130 [Paenibacillus donghaensis]
MRKLFRSESNKRISGLCGGLAQYFGIDASMLRLLTVIAAFFSFGTVLFIYIVASIFIPKETFGSFTDPNEFY